jgi:hypothetical protein
MDSEPTPVAGHDDHEHGDDFEDIFGAPNPAEEADRAGDNVVDILRRILERLIVSCIHVEPPPGPP